MGGCFDMNAEEYLKQIQKIETLIKNKMVEKAQLHQQTLDVALSITPGGETIRKKNEKTGEVEWEDVFGVERVQSSSGGQPFADAVIDNVDTFNRLVEEIKTLKICKKEIISSIEQLDEPEYDTLHMVYVQYLSFSKAAKKRKCSKATVKRLHDSGLESLAELKGGKFPRYVR
jgi:DNA-directed RNA polymerase specialized sigma subunit